MSKRIFITGVGIISSIGIHATETLEALRAGRSGIGQITLFPTMHAGTLPMAEVPLTDSELQKMTGTPSGMTLTRTAMLGIVAAREAVGSANLTGNDLETTGLVSATTVGGMDRSEGFYEQFLADPRSGKLRNVIGHDCGDSTERIAQDLGIRGIITTISTACSSSANAIMTGCELIRSGRVDRVIAGGTDAAALFTLNGFNTLMILDKTGCHPFDDNRAGLTLGEGAAFVVLEPEELVVGKNKEILAEVKGYGNANDAYHQTASSPDGTGAYLAMTKALTMSHLKPSDIDYINAHGTGTENNDLSEGVALQRVFGDQVPPFSSTKGYTGHTLGAAGAIEAVISVLSIVHQTIFPNLRWSTPMKELYIRPVTEIQTHQPIRHILSNSFGFGGNNSTLIISRPVKSE